MLFISIIIIFIFCQVHARCEFLNPLYDIEAFTIIRSSSFSLPDTF